MNLLPTTIQYSTGTIVDFGVTWISSYDIGVEGAAAGAGASYESSTEGEVGFVVAEVGFEGEAGFAGAEAGLGGGTATNTTICCRCRRCWCRIWIWINLKLKMN